MIVVCIHGDEKLGYEAMQLLNREFVIGNPAAFEKNIRLIDEDLNRVFPGNDTTIEGRRAQELLQELQGNNFIIDVHSTTAITEPFVIHVGGTDELIAAVPLQKVVRMEPNMAPGALINHVRGFSLEFNNKTDPQIVADVIEGFFDNLAKNVTVEQKHFSCFASLKDGKIYTNFEPVEIAGEEVIPILSGEKKYDHLSTLLCRRL